MSEPRYAIVKPTSRRRGWSRRRKVGAGIVAVMLTGAIAAVAAMLLQAPITGSSTVTAPAELQFTGTPTITNTNGDGTECTVALDGNGLALDISGHPGGSCDVRAMVQVANNGGQTYVVQDLKYNAVMNIGYTGSSCGKSMVSGQGAVTVDFRLTIPEDAPLGTKPTTSTAGAYAVLAGDYVDANCPRA